MKGKFSPQRHQDIKYFMRKKIKYAPLSDKEEEIAKHIVDSAFQVHNPLGPGLLESVYEVCFCHELESQGLSLKKQVSFPITYKNKKLDSGLRIDILVEDLIICELKAIENLLPIYEAQVLSYLKLTKKRLGFLINFNVEMIKKGIKRIIL
jgi:GxxExxY protein